MDSAEQTELERLRQEVSQLRGQLATARALPPSLHQFALNQISESVCVADSQGCILITNTAHDRSFGYESGELIGKQLFVLSGLPAAQVEGWMKRAADSIEAEGEYQADWLACAKDGTRFFNRLRISTTVTDGQQVWVCISKPLADRKPPEQAHHAGDQRHMFLAEALPQIVWMATPDYRITYINPHWCEYTGLTLQQTGEGGWAAAIHPDDFENTIAESERARNTGGDYRAEYRLRRASDGAYRWHLARSRLLRGSDGVEMWVGTALEIHDRKQAEQALQDSEERVQRQLAELEHIYRTAPVGLNFVDRELRYVRINERLAEMNGLPVEAHIGRSLNEVQSGGVDSSFIYRQVIDNGEPILDREIEFRAKSGNTCHYLASYYPVKDAAGSVLGVTTVMQDITRRKGTEEELAALNCQLGDRVQEFETLLDVVPIAIQVARDAQCNDSTLNRYFREILGTDTLNGKFSFRAFKNGTELSAEDLPLRRALAGGVPVRNEELDITFSDGRSLTFFGHAAPLFDPSGQVRGGFSALLDITERKQAELERSGLLQEEQLLRQQAEQALEQQHQVEQQLLLLVEASVALIETPDSAKVLQTILKLAKRFVGADAYAVWRRELKAPIWRTLADEGLSPSYLRTLTEQIAGVKAMPPHPIPIEDVEQSALVRHRLPEYRAEGIRSMLTVPLRIQGDTQGSIVFYYRTLHQFTESETRVAAGLANLAAAALGTAELYERESRLRLSAEIAEQRARLLAQVGTLLSSSLEYHATLERVAELAVPGFADWASVDIVNRSGEYHRIAVKHVDPEKMALAYEFTRRFPPRDTDPGRVALRTGQSILIDRISDDLIVAGARSPEHLAAVRSLGLTSVMIAPMVVRGRSLGIITFVSAESGRIYTEDDLALAEEIASRAAAAVDNALLHQNVRESEERYRSLISATSSIVWTINSQGEFVEVQPSWQAYTGQTFEEHSGLGWLNAIHPEDRAEIRAESVRARSEGRAYEVQGRIRHAASGQYRYYVTRVVPVLNADGSIREWVGSVTDVHEKKQAERALEESRERLRLAQEAANIGSFDWNLQTNEVVWSEQAEALFGLSPGELNGRYETWLRSLHPDDRALTAQYLAAAAMREGASGLEFRVVWPNGTVRHLRCQGRTYCDSDGQPVRMLGVNIDVTERKRAEAELRATNEALVRTNRALEQFAYSASHDLQEPLRMIAIYSEMIRRRYAGKLDQDADEFIRHMVQGAQRMTMLVSDLLAYTQASNITEQVIEPIDTGAALEQALSNLHSAIEESKAVIRHSNLPRVPVHQVHLRQLLQNLIGNALKYRSTEPPRIEVTAERREDDWLFSVRDNGIGIAPEYKELIFGVFKRLHTAETYPGTGIGLALCQKIVEQYRGRIWVESEQGKGSVFFFTLPNVSRPE